MGGISVQGGTVRKVFLTVGPRASGKSNFCEGAISVDPTVTWMSRDRLLTELFGTTHLDPYTGGHEYALQEMWKRVKRQIRHSPNMRMILDAWNGSSGERVRIIHRLRSMGVDQVDAWFFTTPLESVTEWFWQKPGIAKTSEMAELQGQGFSFYCEDAPAHDYELFHRQASDINGDGFDRVVLINPLIVRPEHILGLQANLKP